MQPIKLSVFKNVFLSTMAITCLLFFYSCNTKIKVASLKYYRDSVNRWLADSSTSQFVLQFYTPNFSANKSLQAISYVIDTNGTCVNPNNPELLDVDSSYTFTNNAAVLGNNIIPRKDFETTIQDSLGHARPYDYILLVPEIDSTYHHVVYGIYVVKDNVILPTFTATTVKTNPCPPDCPPTH